jgi:hypothetical protein
MPVHGRGSNKFMRRSFGFQANIAAKIRLANSAMDAGMVLLAWCRQTTTAYEKNGEHGELRNNRI